MDLLHIGLILVFGFIAGVFAYTESGRNENKYTNTLIFTPIGAVVGFFVYYLGIVILVLIAFGVVIGILKIIFGPKVIYINKT